jgi:hypothetical protein
MSQRDPLAGIRVYVARSQVSNAPARHFKFSTLFRGSLSAPARLIPAFVLYTSQTRLPPRTPLHLDSCRHAVLRCSSSFDQRASRHPATRCVLHQKIPISRVSHQHHVPIVVDMGSADSVDWGNLVHDDPHPRMRRGRFFQDVVCASWPETRRMPSDACVGEETKILVSEVAVSLTSEAFSSCMAGIGSCVWSGVCPWCEEDGRNTLVDCLKTLKG